MNNSHYPSLDRCKKLTELGFPKTELVFSSTHRGEEILGKTEHEEIKKMANFVHHPNPKACVCPSVMEMLDVMPTKLPTGGHRTIVSYEKYSRVFYGRDMRGFAKGTLPNALADLIIWLVENSHLTFPSNE